MTFNISERAARVADILESIEELSKMIAFHHNESKDRSMKSQYESMRQALLNELNTLLATYDLSIQFAA